MTQIISARQAVQMSGTLKQHPTTSVDLAMLAGLKQATVARWLSHLQTAGRVRVDARGTCYRWVEATETQALALAHAVACLGRPVSMN